MPGSIQPHGHLLAFAGPDLHLAQASAQAGRVVGMPLDQAFGQPLDRLLAGRIGSDMLDALRRAPTHDPVQLGIVQLPPGKAFQAIAHRADGTVILELEDVPAGGAMTLETLFPQLREGIRRLQGATTLSGLMTQTAVETRRLTGFDRVLIYRFDASWNGTVIAEDRNDRLPSYLDLRFPASDIPEQARRLYALNRLRLIANADYVPVPILRAGPGDGPPLDLGFSVLRSVSPVHLEYMRNMGTAASMSISIMHGDRLWGLISCHHAEPRQVSFAVRTACDLLGQVLSIQMMALEEKAEAGHRIRAKSVQARLLAHMAGAERFVDGLLRNPADLLALTGAEGAAILLDGQCHRIGRTPAEEDVRRIADHLFAGSAEEVFATGSLAAALPSAESFRDTASGLLAISISQLYPSYVLWFRPEVLQTVKWGGDPHKPASATGMRLSPRKSFETWKETVRLQALPWRSSEIEAARDFRNAIVGIVLRKAEEMAALNEELRRSNSELAAFSYSVSHDLRAPFRHVTSYAELLKARAAGKLDAREHHYLETIIDAASSAGSLVDGLLQFSQLGRATLSSVGIDMGKLLAEVQALLAPETDGRRIRWLVGELPAVQGDPVMLRLVMQNLLSNAIKYTRLREDAVVEVGCRATPEMYEFFVRDNGSGFDMAYAHKLFGVFQRLHREDEFEGIGIGLANVRRIVERHGGRTWAEGRVGQGATFFFSLPRPPAAPHAK